MEPGRDESWGLYLSAARQGVSSAAQAARVLDPDPRGQLRHATGPMYSHLPRTLPTHAVIHDTVFERMASAVPVYAPKAIFGLSERLLAMRAEIETEVRKLAATGSIGGETSQAILDRSAAHLGVLQWSKYLDSPQSDGIPMKAKLKAADELRNSA